MKVEKGFTLIEMMVVVVVIGILASVGYPAYGNYVLRGKIMEATSELSDGRIKMEQSFQDNLTYVGGTCPDPTQNFTFACVGTASTYTITATANLGGKSFVYTINQDNVKTSTTDWGNSGTCWVLKDGGGC